MSIVFVADFTERVLSFTGLTQAHVATTGDEVNERLRTASKMGGTPLNSLLMWAHTGIRSTRAGTQTAGGEYWRPSTIREPYDEAVRRLQMESKGKQGRFNLALQRKGPPLCWFRPGARLRIVGCNSADALARTIAGLLRSRKPDEIGGVYGTTRDFHVDPTGSHGLWARWHEGREAYVADSDPFTYEQMMAPTYETETRGLTEHRWFFEPARN